LPQYSCRTDRHTDRQTYTRTQTQTHIWARLQVL